MTLPDGTTHAGGTSSPETGSKEIRAEPFASQVNIGNVALCAAAWNRAYIDELRHFPNVAYDDQVDASSRAFMRLMEIAGPMDIPDEVMIWARRKAR